MIITVDGFSACGKSTLAKDIAHKLGFKYIDSGAMYRAVTYYLIHNNISLANLNHIESNLSKIEIRFRKIKGRNTCFLNGENIEDVIRGQQVSNLVSEVAAISSVRRKLVQIQREMSRKNDLVMDGRDIGSVVFPNAEIKVFLDADENIRAQRRLEEYNKKGVVIDLKTVVENLKKRDYIDSNRKDSPLKFPKGGIKINNSFLSREEQLSLVLKIFKVVTFKEKK